MGQFFKDDTLDQILEVGAANGWSPSQTHGLIRGELTARARQLKHAGEISADGMDKRLREYFCVGIVYDKQGAGCVTDAPSRIVGFREAEGIMRAMVASALPETPLLHAWTMGQSLSGKYVTMSREGVASVNFSAANCDAVLYVHRDPQRADSHIAQLKSETKVQFAPGISPQAQFANWGVKL